MNHLYERSFRLFSALGEVDPEMVQEAAPAKAGIPWKRIGSLAAVLEREARAPAEPPSFCPTPGPCFPWPRGRTPAS